MDSIVLVSGGMDSAVLAGIVNKETDSSIYMHFNYGQRTEKKELESFNNLVSHYRIQKKHIINLPFFKDLGHSSLVDQHLDIPENSLDPDHIPSTYVPFRNGIFLSYAIAVAEAYDIEKIYIGVVEADSSGYPDCRQEFYRLFNQALKIGTASGKIQIISPLVGLTKKEIIQKGEKLKVPFHYTWSCYQNNDVACGVCDSCLLRKKAFIQANVLDPIEYAAQP